MNSSDTNKNIIFTHYLSELSGDKPMSTYGPPHTQHEIDTVLERLHSRRRTLELFSKHRKLKGLALRRNVHQITMLNNVIRAVSTGDGFRVRGKFIDTAQCRVVL